MFDLLNRVDPTWKYAYPRFRKDKKAGIGKDPNPILASLFDNPFVGVRVYRDRRKSSRKSFRNVGFDESYVDMRRTDKYILHKRIRRLTKQALSRFVSSTRNEVTQQRRGLFPACLYVEAMLQCFEDIQFFLSPQWVEMEQTADGKTRRVYYISKKQKQSVRRSLSTPKGLEKWALCFHVHRNSIMKRIVEIEHETDDVGKIVAFVRRF
jgi:hypothetical protein